MSDRIRDDLAPSGCRRGLCGRRLHRSQRAGILGEGRTARRIGAGSACVQVCLRQRLANLPLKRRRRRGHDRHARLDSIGKRLERGFRVRRRREAERKRRFLCCVRHWQSGEPANDHGIEVERRACERRTASDQRLVQRITVRDRDDREGELAGVPALRQRQQGETEIIECHRVSPRR